MKGKIISEVEFEEPVSCSKDTVFRYELPLGGKTECFVCEKGKERKIKNKE